MPNSINRQELSDYEKAVGSWRKMAEGYNAELGGYNEQANGYNSQVTGYNDQVNAYNASVNEWKSKIASGEYYFSGDGNYYRDPTFGMTDEQKAGAYNINAGWGGEGVGSGAMVTPPTQPQLTVPTRPDLVAPARPESNIKKPSFTLQQERDINKSDSPMVDAERSEKGKFSPFKSEEGLIAQAIKGSRRPGQNQP
jgi:hypothetical protein